MKPDPGYIIAVARLWALDGLVALLKLAVLVVGLWLIT